MTQRPSWRATLVSLLLVCAASAQNAAALEPVPDFVTKYAPLVWLHSLDPFRPSDLLTHVRHTTPTIDQVPVPNLPSLTLDNLALLNGLNGTVALTSKDDVTTLPSWLMGDVPDETGRTANATACVVILVDKGQHEVDAFYFYFYSEHNMVRFHQGKPTGIYYSQHEDGAAYSWADAKLSLQDERPLVFSAYGSHANYVSHGDHIHGKALIDFCDTGILWDPVLSAYFFQFDPQTSHLTRLVHGSPHDDVAPTANLTSFLYFTGLWGDAEYPKHHPLQKTIPFFGLKRFVSGPLGPLAKQLVRRGLFPDRRARKSWIQWAVGVFMTFYPCCVRGWRKWMSGMVLLVVGLGLMLVFWRAVRYHQRRRRRRRGYKKLGMMDIPLSDVA
ncbi:hypothetical protein E4U13_005562 [Claviceps humidiphila]|uniref:Vacuolar protein sorting-associated protein 62 n=1 Tax=Claviceps humidiphila TaxID=1294629 RepID=A0A9P7PXH1_9HYPO|nr:hypothetical protein E4U13_005562 [Claviceps humidiphila]